MKHCAPLALIVAGIGILIREGGGSILELCTVT